jgi:hypothetical protein
MPNKIVYEGNGRYRVVNTMTKQVHSYGTTKEKAEAQLRLLNAIEHGYSVSQKNKSMKKNITYH